MKLIGVIETADGTSKNNSTTVHSGGAFQLPRRFAVQPNADVYLEFGGSAVAATNAGLKVKADSIVDLEIETLGGFTHMAAVPVTAGPAKVQVRARPDAIQR